MMKFLELLTLSVASWSCLAHGQTQTLRTKVVTAHQKQQSHRSLVETSVPFTIELLMETFEEDDGTSVSRNSGAPNDNDYQAVTAAMQKWFHAQSEAYYADHPIADGQVTYVSTTCDLDPEKTTYDPNPTDVFQHQVVMDCEAAFNGPQDDDLETVPDQVDLVSMVSANFAFSEFLENYLAVEVDEGSVFQNVFQARYNMSGSAYNVNMNGSPVPIEAVPMAPVPAPTPSRAPYQIVPSPNAPAPTEEEEEEAPTAPAPAPAPTTGSTQTGPAPTSPSSSGNNGDDATVEMVLEWSVKTPAALLREPTASEYQTFVEQSNLWLSDVFAEYYNDDSSTPTFVSADSSLVSTEYYPEGIEKNPQGVPKFNHVIVVKTNMNFDLADGQETPTMPDYVRVLRDADISAVQEFREEYLMPNSQGTVFEQVGQMQWWFLETFITNDGAAPTAPAPTASSTTATDPAPAPTTATEPATDPAPAPAPTTASATEPAPTTTTTASAPVANPEVTAPGALTLDIEWSLGTPSDELNREPTAQEINDFMAQTEQFIFDEFVAFYNSNPDSLQVQEVTATLVSSDYFPDGIVKNNRGTEFNYVIVVQYDVQFDVPQGEYMPPMHEWVGFLSRAGITGFRTDYLAANIPEDQLFHTVGNLQWGAE